MDWYEKVAAVRVGSVVCPDGAHECPDGQTCCKLASGEWGCCPLPKVSFEFNLLVVCFVLLPEVSDNHLQSILTSTTPSIHYIG